MLAIRIRPLRQSNYDAMIELLQMSGLNPKTKGRDSPRMFAEQLRRNRGAYLGAFDGGRLVGTVLGTNDTRKAWINRLAVHPEYRRRAIGARLLRECERVLRKRGLEAFAESFGGRRVPEHHRRNRRLAPSDVESHRDESFLEVLRVCPELLDVAGLRLEDVDRRGAGRGHGRRVGAAQEPRPRFVEGVVPQVARPSDVSSHDAEGLGERSQFDLDFLLHVEMRRDAPAPIAEDAFPLRIV